MTGNVCELLVVAETFLDIFLGESEEFISEFGFRTFEEVETGFLEREIFELDLRIFAIEFEGIDSRIGGRLITIEGPVTAGDSIFDAILSLRHIDTVVNAGAISDNEGGSFIGFSFCNRFNGLVSIGAQGDGCDVDITVGHSELTEVFFAARFTAGSEFSDSATACGLRGLTASIGVDFGIEDEDIDVTTEGEDVIEAAVTDIVGPAIAAHDPEGAFEEGIRDSEESFGLIGIATSEFSFNGGDISANAFEIGIRFLFAVDEAIYEFVAEFSGEVFDEVLGEVLLLVESESHTETELGVIFEEGVRPSGTMTIFVNGPRRGGKVTTVDGGATSCVGDDHAITEELGDEFDVRRLTATSASARELEERLNEL